MNWENPLIDGVVVEDAAAVEASLGFTAVIPESLGDPLRMVVTNPTGKVPPADRLFALVYQHPQFGRFHIVEHVSEIDQEALEELGKPCAPGSLCEGEWSLVPIRNGITAVLSTWEEGSTFVMWIENGLMIEVVGPPDTFGVEEALSVANAI